MPLKREKVKQQRENQDFREVTDGVKVEKEKSGNDNFNNRGKGLGGVGK